MAHAQADFTEFVLWDPKFWCSCLRRKNMAAGPLVGACVLTVTVTGSSVFSYWGAENCCESLEGMHRVSEILNMQLFWVITRYWKLQTFIKAIVCLLYNSQFIAWEIFLCLYCKRTNYIKSTLFEIQSFLQQHIWSIHLGIRNLSSRSFYIAFRNRNRASFLFRWLYSFKQCLHS